LRVITRAIASAGLANVPGGENVDSVFTFEDHFRFRVFV
jgi:hypothetical protein